MRTKELSSANAADGIEIKSSFESFFVFQFLSSSGENCLIWRYLARHLLIARLRSVFHFAAKSF
jgi:hypothetical protein